MSSYFRALFTAGMQESGQAEVALQAPTDDLDSCEMVLRSLYGQSVQITSSNLLLVMHLADYYGIPLLRSSAEAALHTFVSKESNNCCEKLAEASALRCVAAQRHCLGVLLKDFASAIGQPAFVSLGRSVLAEVLSHEDLDCPREELALEGLIKWVQEHVDGSDESNDVDDLLPLIRWPLLSMAALGSVQSRAPELGRGPLLNELLLEGFRYHSSDAAARARMREANTRCRPRKGMVLLAPLLPEGPWSPGLPPFPPGLTMPSLLSYVWTIPHFASLSCTSMYSPAFSVNGTDHSWKIYVYPRGNNNAGKQLSIYLDSGIADTSDQLTCTFKLVVINYKQMNSDLATPVNAKDCVVKEARHHFSKKAKDWGFREFILLERLADPQAGFLNDGAISIGALLEFEV